MSVSAACPAGWSLSPAEDLCVRAVDSPDLRGEYNIACDKLGARVVDVFKTKEMTDFVYGNFIFSFRHVDCTGMFRI